MSQQSTQGSALDPDAHRAESLAGWEAAAPGWVRRRAEIDRFGAPVSAWMIDALGLQPGQRVLELAAGLGETGMLAAELVAPAGGVIVSDQAEAMLAGARARAEELGLDNVEFRALSAEWIDLPLASVDAVLCRWGYMLLADPAAALTETRRVLRPGGRLALAVWDALEHNPWAGLPMQELLEHGAAPAPGAPSSAPASGVPAPGAPSSAPASGAPVPGVPSSAPASGVPGAPAPGVPTPGVPAPAAPGPFALGDPERLRALLASAGFAEIDIQTVDVVQRHPSFDSFWETTLDLSRNFHNAVLSRPEGEIAAIRAGLAARAEPFAAPDGTLAIPGRTLAAAAGA